MSNEQVTKRLHVGGITPNITTSHIKERFSIFGKVRNIEELRPNALGDPRPFTFLTIDTSAVQLKKCLNIMSGSTWRGTTLRLAEAKPKYQDRLEKERNPTPESLKLRIDKKRKRSTRENAAEGVGKEAQDMRVPSLQNYQSKKYWSVDSSSNLVRPLSMRPSHPIRAAIVSETTNPPIASTSQIAERPRLPPKRARRRVIDPTRWCNEHLDQQAFQNSAEGELEDGWEYEDLDEGEGVVTETADQQRLLEDRRKIGVWKRTLDGEVVDEEFVHVSRRRVVEAQMSDNEEDIAMEDDSSELFGIRDRQSSGSVGGSRSPSPLFPRTRTAEDETQQPTPESFLNRAGQRAISRSTSPLFTERVRNDQTASPVNHIASHSTSPSPSNLSLSPAKSASPLFPTQAQPVETSLWSSSPPADLPSDHTPPLELASHTLPFIALPEPLLATVRAERSRDLDLFRDLLGYDGDVPTMKQGRSEWAGFEESDDEDAVERPGLLRLRGGAGSSDDDESEGEDGSGEGDESDEESTSESSESGSDSSDSAAEAMVVDGRTASETAKPTTLKDMFAPSARANAGNFSLFADVHLDLDENLDIPLQPTESGRLQPELEPLQPLPQKTLTGIFELDPSAHMFFATPALGTKENGEVDGFWRAETDEEMRAIWERDRLELTREWKRRYRDARKQKRRRGGAEGELD